MACPRYPFMLHDGKGDLQQTFGPENTVHYLYAAVFSSPMYRTRDAEFLKIDFPRVPLTSDGLLFCDLCLIELHLMEKRGTLTQKVDFTCSVNEPARGRVWINTRQ
jgi:hypothetical protein